MVFRRSGYGTSKKWRGSSKRVLWYFEEGGVVRRRGCCGTLKRVLWYFEEGGVVLWYDMHTDSRSNAGAGAALSIR